MRWWAISSTDSVAPQSGAAHALAAMNAAAILAIRVPASTSNVGAGFDCLGLAFQLHNEFAVRLAGAGEGSLRFAGPEAGGLRSRGRTNPFFRAAERLAAEAGIALPRMDVACTVNVPNARGLGSSSTATVAGLLAANHFAKGAVDADGLLRLASAIEGHPDNAAPALLGGLVHALVAADGRVLRKRALPSPKLAFFILVPPWHVATAQARAVLPRAVPHRDAVANAARAGLLFDAIAEGSGTDLAVLTEDKLHEPYRMKLFPRFREFKRAALEAGAHCVTVSGAGPAMLAIVGASDAAAFGPKWQAAASAVDAACRVMRMEVDAEGATVQDA